MRLDIYLRQKYLEFSRSQIIKHIKNGSVLVNGNTVKPSYLIKPNDKVVFNAPSQKQAIKLRSDSSIKPDIIYEDKDILVINKPSGLSVHPSLNNPDEITLVNGLISYLPSIKRVGEDILRPGIVHRLDKETSGILLVAKNNKSFYELKQQFQNHDIKKTYLALVYGQVKQGKGEIDLAIGRSVNNPLKQAVSRPKSRIKKLRPAITEYKVIKKYDKFTLLEVNPKTGRTHQIRVHLSSIGHPIVGDTKYGFKKQKMPINLKRHFLHAYVLEFSLNGKKFKFETDLPKDLQRFLEQMRK